MNIYKILIAEDDELVSYLLSVGLKKAGYAVEVCENGSEAINSLCNDHFDLVISDLNLPYTNGLEIISFIRNDMQSQLPIITLSAYEAASVKQECLVMGANGYITKPFATKELLFVIEKLLKGEILTSY